MSVRPRARIGLFVLAALGVGLVAPCLCGPAARVIQASHGCCEGEAGWKPAPMDCCAACSTSIPQDPRLLRDSPPPFLVALTPSLDELSLGRISVTLAPRPGRLLVLAPPRILRV